MPSRTLLVQAYQNMQLQAGANLNLKPPTARQLQQRNIASPMQRPSSVANSIVNGIDGQLNGVMNGQMNGAGLRVQCLGVRYLCARRPRMAPARG
ncbi:hypothetical protein NLJ89_g2963 [Agrocybe chaxingu]|uniref:Uncharacterized protein n=1 Tax=Agrocybe chaxingu TaxID=84603 RepID=A0A9W8K3D7_9AGAR|nr:hypothetical protein NLJ89_g2963 [Agrocybe chaxingu]